MMRMLFGQKGFSTVLFLVLGLVACAQGTERKGNTLPLEQGNEKGTLGISLSSEAFNEIFDPMYYSSISYKQPTKLGSILGRVNLNNRFASWGSQYEVDLYPKIKEGSYAYLNYGFSNDAIFPQHRFGGEVYTNLPGGWEASVGTRWLQFEADNASIYTGSVGLYQGNWYFTLRPYITPQSEGRTSMSMAFSARKYLKNAETYWGISFSMGNSPEIQNTAAGLVFNIISSQDLRLDYQAALIKGAAPIGLSLGLARQEKVFDPNSYFVALTGGISYSFGGW